MGLAKTPWQGDVWEVLDETLLLHALFLLYLQNGRFHRKEHFLTKRFWRRFFFFLYHKAFCGQETRVFSHDGPRWGCGNPRPESHLCLSQTSMAKSPQSLMRFWLRSHWCGAAGRGFSKCMVHPAQILAVSHLTHQQTPALTVSPKRI